MGAKISVRFPIANWSTETSELKRELLEHVLDGCVETHFNPELESAIAKNTPKQPPRTL